MVALRDVLASNPRETLLGAESAKLHRVLCAVVDDLKALEWPPELVLISVKEVAAEAGYRASGHFTPADRSLANRDELIRRITRWTIERYFRKEPPEGRESVGDSVSSI